MKTKIKVTELVRAVRGKKFVVEFVIKIGRKDEQVIELGRGKTIEDAINIANEFKKTLMYAKLEVINAQGNDISVLVEQVPERVLTLDDVEQSTTEEEAVEDDAQIAIHEVLADAE